MRAQLGMLSVEQVIVHDVPVRRAGVDGPDLKLSEIDCELTPDLRNYFKERIVDSLSATASSVELDGASSSPIPPIVRDSLAGDDADFVARSQTMARHLHQSQTGVNTPGLLTIARCQIDGKSALAVLKLEREVALALELIEREHKATFSLQHLKNLMLNERTRVFKVGLFVKDDTAPDGVDGLVCDKQRGYAIKKGIADFFLRTYLGCKLKEEPDVTTQRFYDAAETFVNSSVKDPAKRARYEIALLSELSSAGPTLNAREFAKVHLDLEDRQPFVDSLQESGLSEVEFEKNTERIKPQLRRIHMSFAKGIAVLGTPEAFAESVEITDLDDGRTRVEIEDQLKEVRGKR